MKPRSKYTIEQMQKAFPQNPNHKKSVYEGLHEIFFKGTWAFMTSIIQSLPLAGKKQEVSESKDEDRLCLSESSLAIIEHLEGVLKNAEQSSDPENNPTLSILNTAMNVRLPSVNEITIAIQEVGVPSMPPLFDSEDSDAERSAIHSNIPSLSSYQAVDLEVALPVVEEQRAAEIINSAVADESSPTSFFTYAGSIAKSIYARMFHPQHIYAVIEDKPAPANRSQV